jgi:hypothetical protein
MRRRTAWGRGLVGCVFLRVRYWYSMETAEAPDEAVRWICNEVSVMSQLHRSIVSNERAMLSKLPASDNESSGKPKTHPSPLPLRTRLSNTLRLLQTSATSTSDRSPTSSERVAELVGEFAARLVDFLAALEHAATVLPCFRGSGHCVLELLGSVIVIEVGCSRGVGWIGRGWRVRRNRREEQERRERGEEHSSSNSQGSAVQGCHDTVVLVPTHALCSAVGRTERTLISPSQHRVQRQRNCRRSTPWLIQWVSYWTA